MTYLDLVNNVLFRLREKPAVTVYQQSDAVINMAKTLVNDAKRHVEASHRWTALETTWYIEHRDVFGPSPKEQATKGAPPPPFWGDNDPDGDIGLGDIILEGNIVRDREAKRVWSIYDYNLPDTQNGCSITNVFNEKGAIIRQVHPDEIHKWQLSSPEKVGHAQFYCVVGRKNEAGYAIRVWPKPDRALPIQDRLTVKGYSTTPDMTKDEDVLVIPSQPVLYYALALAARERGEVGGQTAQELFAMAANYISDAIAIDFNVTPFNNTWAAV